MVFAEVSAHTIVACVPFFSTWRCVPLSSCIASVKANFVRSVRSRPSFSVTVQATVSVLVLAVPALATVVALNAGETEAVPKLVFSPCQEAVLRFGAASSSAGTLFTVAR